DGTNITYLWSLTNQNGAIDNSKFTTGRAGPTASFTLGAAHGQWLVTLKVSDTKKAPSYAYNVILQGVNAGDKDWDKGVTNIGYATPAVGGSSDNVYVTEFANDSIAAVLADGSNKAWENTSAYGAEGSVAALGSRQYVGTNNAQLDCHADAAAIT